MVAGNRGGAARHTCARKSKHVMCSRNFPEPENFPKQVPSKASSLRPMALAPFNTCSLT